MTCFFFFATICSLPALYFFYNGNDPDSTAIKNTISRFSLGNLGESTFVCNFKDLPDDGSNTTIPIFCSYGTISDIIVAGVGISDTKCDTDN